MPVFLASSFAFIAPIIYGVPTWGLPATLGGMVVAGAVYVVLSFIIRWRGTEIIMPVSYTHLDVYKRQLGNSDGVVLSTDLKLEDEYQMEKLFEEMTAERAKKTS